MAEGRRQEWRAMLVAQAALVWTVTDDKLDPYALEMFVLTGGMDAAQRVMPYRPDVLKAIQESMTPGGE